MAFAPVVRNVQLEKVTSTASPRVLFIRGFDGAKIEGIRLIDCTFGGISRPDVMEHVGAVSFVRTTTAPAQLPPASPPANP